MVTADAINRKLKVISGLNGDLTVLASFVWFIYNAYCGISGGMILLNRGQTTFSGMGSIETYMVAVVLVTFLPHACCLLKNQVGRSTKEKWITTFLIVLAFAIHLLTSYRMSEMIYN
jgi:hypothetical protein